LPDTNSCQEYRFRCTRAPINMTGRIRLLFTTILVVYETYATDRFVRYNAVTDNVATRRYCCRANTNDSCDYLMRRSMLADSSSMNESAGRC